MLIDIEYHAFQSFWSKQPKDAVYSSEIHLEWMKFRENYVHTFEDGTSLSYKQWEQGNKARLNQEVTLSEISLIQAYNKLEEHRNDQDPNFLSNFQASERMWESEDPQLKKVYEQRLFHQDKRTVDCVYGYLDTDRFYRIKEDTEKRQRLRQKDKKQLDKI